MYLWNGPTHTPSDGYKGKLLYTLEGSTGPEVTANDHYPVYFLPSCMGIWGLDSNGQKMAKMVAVTNMIRSQMDWGFLSVSHSLRSPTAISRGHTSSLWRDPGDTET